MGQVILDVLTPFQKEVINEFASDKNLREHFYLGGGTALSAFYLRHRYSDDLDFFNFGVFDRNVIMYFINKVCKNLKVEAHITKKDTVILFELSRGKERLKVDFLDFPYLQIGRIKLKNNIRIDSLRDIGANKIMTINLQPTVKDYVDLYFIIQERYTIWDLLYAVESKYALQLDLLSLGEDFLEAQKFTYLPRMIKPLDLNKLKEFYLDLARKLGKKVSK